MTEDAKKERKPLSSAVTLPTDEEIEQMRANGTFIEKPKPGTREWDDTYTPYTKRRRLQAAIYEVLDQALSDGVISLDGVGTFLDGCKPDYHKVLHQLRREPDQPYTPYIVRTLSALRKVREEDGR
jgi:hypothetical protein